MVYFLSCDFIIDQKKVDDARMTKEIRQLQKESRKRDNKIRSLESDAQRRELVLKRRQEEVCKVLHGCIKFQESIAIPALSSPTGETKYNSWPSKCSSVKQPVLC